MKHITRIDFNKTTSLLIKTAVFQSWV